MIQDFSTGQRASVIILPFLACSLTSQPLTQSSFRSTQCQNSSLRHQTHQTLILNVILNQFHKIPSSEIFALLESYAPLIGSYVPPFRNNLSVPSSRVKQSLQNSSVPNYQSKFFRSQKREYLIGTSVEVWHLTTFFVVSQVGFLINSLYIVILICCTVHLL
jgi:hypothetical protein